MCLKYSVLVCLLGFTPAVGFSVAPFSGAARPFRPPSRPALFPLARSAALVDPPWRRPLRARVFLLADSGPADFLRPFEAAPPPERVVAAVEEAYRRAPKDTRLTAADLAAASASNFLSSFFRPFLNLFQLLPTKMCENSIT